jgi:signal transduction histidine kinase
MTMLASISMDDCDQFQQTIESLPEAIALLDLTGRIVAANEAWRRNVARLGYDTLFVGGNYREVCVGNVSVSPDSAAVVAGFDSVVEERAARFRHLYQGTVLTQGHDFELCMAPLRLAGSRFVVLATYDVTAERQLRQQCRRLESDILRVEAVERQRIGRDLHDSTAQELVALRLSLGRLKQLGPDHEAMAVISDIESTLDQMSDEIRTIAYLLHPPSLETIGLVEALETMIAGFARRIGLDIVFSFEGKAEHWDPLVETALYRLTQEALANIQRHAQASQGRIRLVARRRGYLHLFVEDNGVGIRLASSQAPAMPGVGLSSMRARIHELGGRFAIRRCDYGTRIRASVRAEPDARRSEREEQRIKQRVIDRRVLEQVEDRLRAALAPPLPHAGRADSPKRQPVRKGQGRGAGHPSRNRPRDSFRQRRLAEVADRSSRQAGLIERMRVQGEDTQLAEKVLATFEEMLALAEGHETRDRGMEASGSG